MATPAIHCRRESFRMRGRKATLVRLTDRNAGVECAVVPDAGGEVASLRVKRHRRWHELLVNALDYSDNPPEGWEGRAPLLWPANARTFTDEQMAQGKAESHSPKKCRYILDGKTYTIPMHGFARYMKWTLTDHGVEDGKPFAVCEVESNRDTRRMYPFDFRLKATHTLSGATLSSRVEVAAGENDQPMPFAIGNHIGFRLPIDKQSTYDECTVKTPGTRRFFFNAFALPDGRYAKLDLQKPAPLSTGVWSNTYVGGFKRPTAWAELADPNALAIRVSQTERPIRAKRRVKHSDLRFVIFGSPDRGFLCLEPWIGDPNFLNRRRGGVELPAGERFVWEMRVQLKGIA